tara:strand:+ start:109945 stop:112941 length:2997 start_codon:yes stop_codon:yes gene_type:complete
LLLRVLIIFLLSTIAVRAQQSVRFSPDAGVHYNLKEVTVQVPENSKVFYSMHGEKPTIRSTRLKSDRIKLQGNTAIRFLEIDPDGNESRYSKTYIIDKKHDIPVFSIIIDPDYLFDRNNGMYMIGPSCTEYEEPYTGANFMKDIERDSRIGFINENNEQVIDQVSGLKMFGGFSLGMPQKSFALYARKKYGNNRFEYPFFKDRPFKEYKNLVLRNAGSDMQGAHIRDAFATTLVKPTGLLVQSYRPVAVYINGQYWGKYNLREKINEHFIKQHFGYDKDSLIIMRHEKRPQYGSTRDYRTFLNRLRKLDLSKAEDLAYVDSKIDIKNYLLYNACEVYTGNADAGGNIRYYKHTSDTAKWRWIFYDVDHSMNIFTDDAYLKNSVKHFTTENPRDWPHPNWSTFLMRKLLENDSIKELYIQQFSDLLNTTFKTENALQVLDDLKDQVEQESVYHKDRWGVSDRIYEYSFDKIYTHIKHRPELLFDQLKDRFDLEERIEVEVLTSKGGKVKLNNLTITNKFKGEYFKGLPLTVEAIPDFDYRFVGWRRLEKKSLKFELVPQESIVLIPVFEKREGSQFVNQVVINEIDAEQDKAFDTDYIELLSTSDRTLDISNWIIADDENYFVLPNNLFLESGAYLVITQDSMRYQKRYKNHNFIGGLSFGINKKGERIRLYDADSMLVDQVSTKKWKHERQNMNWARVTGNCEDEYFNNWIMERPTPGDQNGFCGELYANNERNKKISFWLLISGSIIGGIGLVIIIFRLLIRIEMERMLSGFAKYKRMIFMIILLLFCSFFTAAQNYKKIKPYSWMVGAHWNVMEDDGYQFTRLFDVNNSWNLPVFPASINADFYIQKGMSIDVIASYNQYKVGKTINLDTNRSGNAYAVTTNFKYSFGFLMRQQIIDPFVFGGVGYSGRQAVELTNMLNGNIGAGVNIMVWRGLGIQFRSTAKVMLLPEIIKDNYFHHHAGIIYKIPEQTGGYNNFHKRKYKWGFKNYRYRKPKGM